MKRSTKYEINSIITTIIVFAIVVVAMLISTKHPYKIDLTKQKKYTLSDQTIKLVKGLTVPVKALAFYSKGTPGEDAAKTLLEQYHYLNPRFTYDFIDTDRDPMAAKKYDITLPGVIVIEAAGKNEKVRTADEESLTNGLMKVSKGGKKMAYFLTGHGELSIDDAQNNGLSKLKESLEKEVYQVAVIDFIKDKKIPDDASVLVICGPKKPLFKEELDIIRQFMDKGGRVFLMLGSDSSKEINEFLLSYGFKVEDDLIIDQVSQMFGGHYLIPAIMQYGTHAIVDRFKLGCFFPMCRSIQLDKAKAPAASELMELAFSSNKSWAEKDIDGMEKKKKVQFNAKIDRQGPCCVAVAGTYKAPSAPPPPPPAPGDTKKPEEKKARLVVFGSSQIADNAYLAQSGNRDIILNAMGWLSEEESLISIRPRDEKGTPLSLTPSDVRFLFFFSVLFLPLLIIIIGIYVKIRRN
jgi:ABC-type uncharacterized transport system involved in gliding motility auxiliary subunit